MAVRQEIWVDFGISGLTKWFHGPWHTLATPVEVVEGAADWGKGGYAPTLLDDALRLLDSSLSTEVLTTLWLAACGRNFDFGVLGVDARGWLRRIADICVERIRRDDPSFVPVNPGPAPYPELRDQVLAEIRAVGPQLAAAASERGPLMVPDVVPALERVAADVDPDLGYRLFLRAMKVYMVTISEARYVRYLELGELFGYNEFVVDDGTLHSVPDQD
jgi:hypothetical protein